MEWYEEDFYDEPSEFEQAVDEFKQGLMKSVKEEFVGEMERLRKENAELQDVKKNFEQVKRDFDVKKRELESEYQKLKGNVRRERLVDLLKDHQITLYKALSKRKVPPKCDKCDKYRKIKYTSPLGRETSEDCLCKEGKIVCFPEEYVRYEFRLSRNQSDVTAWYRQYNDDEDGLVYDSSIRAEYIYSSDMDFKDIKQYSTFFKTKEECQRYCDFLNSKEV
jgi:hypothetical protein